MRLTSVHDLAAICPTQAKCKEFMGVLRTLTFQFYFHTVDTSFARPHLPCADGNEAGSGKCFGWEVQVTYDFSTRGHITVVSK